MGTPTLNPLVASAFESAHKEMDQKGIVGLESLKKQQASLRQQAAELMVAAEIIGQTIAIIERSEATAHEHHEKNVFSAIAKAASNSGFKPQVVAMPINGNETLLINNDYDGANTFATGTAVALDTY